MADFPASHVSASLLKEVYLLTRFVARKAQTASQHQAERAKLLQDLDTEHLYIRTFGLVFFRQRRGGRKLKESK